MNQIRAPCIGRAHELIVKKMFYDGVIIDTEDDEVTLEFPNADSSVISIENPLSEPMVNPKSRFQETFMKHYAKDLIFGSDSVFEYDYHGRLFHYRPYDDKPEIDQISYIVEKLKSNPQSRRALAITWYPNYDETLSNCPCLQLVQCTIRNDRNGETKMNEKVVFRSNDMQTAAGANMFALACLQKDIADKLSLPIGNYEHISLVPHIYPIRDIGDIYRMLSDKGELDSHGRFVKRLNELSGSSEILKSHVEEWASTDYKF